MPSLTDRTVAALSIPEGKREAWLSDAVVKGLRLRATPGSKTFFVCWTDRATGERRREKLGAWGSITIEQARDAARIVMGRIAAGADPAAERAARAAEAARRKAEAARAASEAAFTLDALLTDWQALHLCNRRPRYAAEATRAMRAAFKAHLATPAAALDHAAVLRVVDGFTKAGKPTTAGLILRYGSACYGWAVKRRRLAHNPFAGLPKPDHKAERDRVLTDAEIGEVWRAAGTLPAPYGPAVKLLLLTLARRDEVNGMTWGEIAPDLSAWTQPPRRTKNGEAHVVHLAAPARALLRDRLGIAPDAPLPALPPSDALVFGVLHGGALRPIGGHNWVKRELDKAIAKERATRGAEPMQPWVLHDFRRTGVTWLAGAGFPPHVADRLLNHTQGAINGVARIYQRNQFLPERAAALDAWAAHVLAMGEGAPMPAVVVPLERRRART
ncbi:tyrosine-type recombinase/integrase [Rubritepida flocculans]|uniref:tyrosine-type recombinase/integrase n=1 Tax=Rubritepida flocculans TaxID=182403 RepID=UPI0004844440|nr:integrase arm-type DNA-binding domain-containing protein [Rubritepida flocculans]